MTNTAKAHITEIAGSMIRRTIKTHGVRVIRDAREVEVAGINYWIAEATVSGREVHVAWQPGAVAVVKVDGRVKGIPAAHVITGNAWELVYGPADEAARKPVAPANEFGQLSMSW